MWCRDLFCLGKGISSSVPISAVIGKKDILDVYGPNEMTSTHTGNPISCAAAAANLKIIKNEGLVENAAKMGEILSNELAKIADEFADVVGFVAGLQIVKKGTKEPDGDLAWEIVNLCFRKGLLMFAPVGFGSGCVKIAPPLCITKEALLEGCQVVREAMKQLV